AVTVLEGARFFARAAFVGVGGFAEARSGPEDWDLDKKMKRIGAIALADATRCEGSSPHWGLGDDILRKGVDWRVAPAAIFHDESEFDLGRYLKKKSYYIGSFQPYVAKWGADDADVRRQLGVWYRFVGVFWEAGKWHRLVRNPLLACGMYFLRAMVGLSFLWRRSFWGTCRSRDKATGG
ncbi:MAG: glycosyl transferase, partial [Verrucomicrobiae bacterium]|nr:glycosyl transferase [Verrucomicrobiae bacterium]